MTTQETMLANIADLKKDLDQANAALKAVQADPQQSSNKGIITLLGSSPGWIDATGVYWDDASARAQHATALTQQIQWKKDIKAATDIVTDATTNCNQAKKALAEYMAASPTQRSAIDKIYQSAGENKLLFFGGVLLALSLISYAIYYFIKKNKKQPK